MTCPLKLYVGTSSAGATGSAAGGASGGAAAGGASGGAAAGFPMQPLIKGTTIANTATRLTTMINFDNPFLFTF
jgi:hypothetical protein